MGQSHGARQRVHARFAHAAVLQRKIRKEVALTPELSMPSGGAHIGTLTPSLVAAAQLMTQTSIVACVSHEEAE